jgi:O-antigen/teichoic acid export membrane protein
LEGVGLVGPNHQHQWFKGAIILTVGALITKILSAVYRIPFQNIVGDVGFYIYQQVYPFFGLALVISTYGFPVMISKRYIELSEGQQPGRASLFVIQSFFILLVLGFLSFLSLFYGADWLATQMDDPNLAQILQVIALVFLIFPVVSVLRGYFQGIGNMVPTAVSQVAEQLIRVLTILICAIVFTNKGFSLYIVGSGAAFGSITGGLMAILILIIFFLSHKKVSWSKPLPSFFSGMGSVAKLVLIQGFAVCISGMVLIFLQLADSLNMLSLLVQADIDIEAAKELKGIYDRGQPLIQLGTIVATSMSLSLVPIISSARIKATQDGLHEKITFALRISFIIGLAATIGLLAIILPTNMMLYENHAGTSVLAWLTPIIFGGSVILTLIAILQGLGVMYFPAGVILVIFLAKYGMNHLLIPDIGAVGAAIASNASMALGCVLLWWKLRRIVKGPFISPPFIIKLSLALAIMYIALSFIQAITNQLYPFVSSERLVAFIQATGGAVLGGLLFLTVILRMGLVRLEDLILLPFGSKLLYLLPKEKGSKRLWKKIK